MKLLRVFADIASILNLILLLSSGISLDFLRSVGSWLPGPFLFINMLLLQTVVSYALLRLAERVMPKLDPVGSFLALFAILAIVGFICAFDAVLFYTMIGYQPDKPAGEALANFVMLFFTGSVIASASPWLVTLRFRYNVDDDRIVMALAIWFGITFIGSLMIWWSWLAMGS